MNAITRTAGALAVFLGLASSATLFADTPGSAASGNSTITVTAIGKISRGKQMAPMYRVLGAQKERPARARIKGCRGSVVTGPACSRQLR